MQERDELLKKIDVLREELHRMIESKDISANKVLFKSQKLDELHVKYQKLTGKDDE